MNSKEEKTLRSLLGKLDRLQTESQVQLTHDEARLYQIETLDELPEEDHVEPEIPLGNGS
ncbi:hypothetical protein [Pleomorphovibrio marinus]|uniref:hypothetical protein n=1 Tax=Pleomorphovibrio marinus TaxID=2164132 RepID=UPI000E0B4605|nr:hypothetical protein [Pleomorphovibrio marinus]